MITYSIYNQHFKNCGNNFMFVPQNSSNKIFQNFERFIVKILG